MAAASKKARLRRRMTPAGLMCLLTSSETDLLTPCALLLLEGRLTAGQVVDLMEERAVGRFNRLTCLVDNGIFVSDPNFSVRRHLRVATLDSRADKDEQLHKYIDRVSCVPLATDIPLWEMHLINNYGDSTALLFRAHHCLGDGVSFAYMIYCLTDEGNAKVAAEAQQRVDRKAALDAGAFHGRVIDRVVEFVKSVTIFLYFLYLFLFRGLSVSWKHLRHLTHTEPQTPFNKPLAIRKHNVWTALDFDRVKRCSKLTHTTINDVLLNCVAGAFRRHLDQASFAFPPRYVVHCGIPVNIRTSPIIEDLRNKIGAIVIGLPLHIKDPIDRLQSIHAQALKCKTSPEPHMAYLMSKVMQWLPLAIIKPFVTHMGKTATVMLTNVRFQKETLHVKGTVMTQLLPLVSPTPGIGIGFGVTSYRDKVDVTVAVDSNVEVPAERVMTLFIAEFEAMLTAAEKRENNAVFES